MFSMIALATLFVGFYIYKVCKGDLDNIPRKYYGIKNLKNDLL